MRTRPALLLALTVLLAPMAVTAQPPPPNLPNHRFIGFLEVTTTGEEPLPSLIRREYADKPALWSQLEAYLSTYYPNALTGPRSRTVKRGAYLRLPLYGIAAPLTVLAAPPPPPPVVAPPPPPAQQPIIGAVVAAERLVAVSTERGQTRELRLQDPVHRGETISTDDRGEANIRLLDGTLVMLRPDSSVLLQEFRFAKNDTNQGALSLKLVKGAMRTVSGMIPKDPASQYSLQTPGGAVKVRGTDYAVRWCDAAAQCRLDGAPAEPGLYAGVLEGGIDVGTGGGTTQAGDIVKLRDASQPPAPAPEAASLVFTPPELAMLPAPRCVETQNRPPYRCKGR